MARHTNGSVRGTSVRAGALCCAMLSALTVGCSMDEGDESAESLRASEHKRIDGGVDPSLDASRPTDDADASDAATPPAPDASTTDGGTVPSDDGLTLTSVKANGTGCPPGSWKSELSGDGKHVVVRFSAYELSLTPDESVAVADCSLAIKLHSPKGVSFSFKRAQLGGNAYLEAGVTARQTAQYYFQGDPVDGGEVRTELNGPFDDVFVLNDEVASTDAVWSTCGVERDLNVLTRVRLQNGEPKKTGYLVLDRVMDVELATRPCP